ncbi:Dynein light chain [Oleoguttula sp. CCFEE 5521]
MADISKEDVKEKMEAQVKSVDMSEDMQQEAIDVAQEAMEKFTIEKEIAHHIKKTVRPLPSNARATTKY